MVLTIRSRSCMPPRNTYEPATISTDARVECVHALGTERPVFGELPADNEVITLVEDRVLSIGKNCGGLHRG